MFVFTGFEPFGDHDYNPSWDVAQAAARVCGSACHLLAVDFETAKSAWELSEPDDVLIHVGVAASRQTVDFERFAHNATGDYESLSEGVMSLDANGPLARTTDLALRKMVDEWGIEPAARESRDAGVYVCNATLFHSLGHRRAIFVHVPMVDEEVARTLGEELGRVVQAALR